MENLQRNKRISVFACNVSRTSSIIDFNSKYNPFATKFSVTIFVSLHLNISTSVASREYKS